MFASRKRKEREPISSVKVEASTKDTWSSGHALPVPICRASRTPRTTENYIVGRSFMRRYNTSTTHLPWYTKEYVHRCQTQCKRWLNRKLCSCLFDHIVQYVINCVSFTIINTVCIFSIITAINDWKKYRATLQKKAMEYFRSEYSLMSFEVLFISTNLFRREIP